MDTLVGPPDVFRKKALEMYLKYEWSRVGEVEDLVQKMGKDQKEQKAFWKKKLKAWDVKDNLQPKDKKKDKARYKQRLEAFFERHDPKRISEAEKLTGKEEAVVFRDLFEQYRIQPDGEPEPSMSPDAARFVLECFYLLHSPSGLGKVQALVETIERGDHTLDSILQQMTQRYQAAAGDWMGGVLATAPLTFIIEEFYQRYNPDFLNEREKLEKRVHDIQQGGVEARDNFFSQLCEKYKAEVEDWVGDYPPIMTTILQEANEKMLWLEGFFNNFARDDVVRVEELAAQPRPLENILRDLYEEYKIEEEDVWAFELNLRFSSEQIAEDYNHRLQEFFDKHAPGQESAIPELVDEVVREQMHDADFWERVYSQYGVSMGEPWPASRLEGAPPPRAPDPAIAARQPSNPPSAASTQRKPPSNPPSRPPTPPKQESRRGSTASQPRTASRHSSMAMRQPDGGSRGTPQQPYPTPQQPYHTPQQPYPTPQDNYLQPPATPSSPVLPMVIPGTLVVQGYDITRLIDSAAQHRLGDSAKWDLSKAFSHPLEATVIDSVRGSPLAVAFHLRCTSDNAHHIHASVKQVLGNRAVPLPSLQQEYHKITGTDVPANVDYIKSCLREPLTAEAHKSDLEKARQQQKTELRDKLAYFHVKHAPADMGNIDRLLAESGLEEADLFEALYARYGLGKYDGRYNGDAWRSRATSEGDSVKGRLRSFFDTHDPHRSTEKTEDAMRAINSGVSEDALMKGLRQAYGVEGGQSKEDRLRQRVTEFYLTHNPAELYKVELALQSGLSEEQLFARLHQKYGLPPPEFSSTSTAAPPPPTPAPPQRVATPPTVHSSDILRKERALFEEAVSLEMREKALHERELAIERMAEERKHTVAMREASLGSWEAKLSAREDSLRQRETSLVQREIAEKSLPCPTCIKRGDALRDQELVIEMAQSVKDREVRLEEREARVQARWREVAEREVLVAEREATMKARLETRERELNDSYLDARQTKVLQQEAQLRQLSQRVERQVKEMAEREEEFGRRELALSDRETAVALREAHMAAERRKERMPSPGAVAAEGLLAEQLRAADERERAVAARELKLQEREGQMRQADVEFARRESILSHREKDLEQREKEAYRLQEENTQRAGRQAAEESAMERRHKDLASRESRIADRLARLEQREAQLLEKERTLETRERQRIDGKFSPSPEMHHEESSSNTILSIRLRDVEHRAKILEQREVKLEERESLFARRELQLSEKEAVLAAKQAQTMERTAALNAETAALSERERLVGLHEDELRKRQTTLTLQNEELLGLKTKCQSLEQELDAQLRAVAEREAAVGRREAELAASEERIRTRLDDGMRQLAEREASQANLADAARRRADDLAVLETKLEERGARLQRQEQALEDREERIAMQESVLAEQERILHRRMEQTEKKEAFVGELEESLLRKEELVTQTLREIEAKEGQEDRLHERLQRLKDRENRLAAREHAAAERDREIAQREQRLRNKEIAVAKTRTDSSYSVDTLSSPPMMSPPTISPQRHRPSTSTDRLSYTQSIQADLDSIRSSLATLAKPRADMYRRSPVSRNLSPPVA